jgi:hypothetical protein
MKPHTKKLLTGALLLITTFSCQDKIDEFLSDDYQKQKIVPRLALTVNIEGKLLVKFFQNITPGINGNENVIYNYLKVTNLTDQTLNNVTFLVRIYADDSLQTHKNLLLDRSIQVNSGLEPDKTDSLTLDAFYDQVLTSKNLTLAIIEWNSNTTLLSGIYGGVYEAYKADTLVRGGVVSGFITYNGNVSFELAEDSTFTFINGNCLPAGKFFGQHLNIRQQKKGDLNGVIRVNQDTLTSGFRISNSSRYDSLKLTLNAL